MTLTNGFEPLRDANERRQWQSQEEKMIDKANAAMAEGEPKKRGRKPNEQLTIMSVPQFRDATSSGEIKPANTERIVAINVQGKEIGDVLAVFKADLPEGTHYLIRTPKTRMKKDAANDDEGFDDATSEEDGPQA